MTAKGAANCAAEIDLLRREGAINRKTRLHWEKAGASAIKNRTAGIFSLFRLAEYAIIIAQVVEGAGSHTLFRKGVVDVSTFEAMYLMVAFATLVVLIIKQK